MLRRHWRTHMATVSTDLQRKGPHCLMAGWKKPLEQGLAMWNESLGSQGWPSLSDCTQRGCRTVTSVWTAHWREYSRLSELGILRASRVTPKDSMICQCRCCILGGCMTCPPEIAAPFLAGLPGCKTSTARLHGPACTACRVRANCRDLGRLCT